MKTHFVSQFSYSQIQIKTRKIYCAEENLSVVDCVVEYPWDVPTAVLPPWVDAPTAEVVAVESTTL